MGRLFSKGSPEQFISKLQDRIEYLEGTSVESSEDFFDEVEDTEEYIESAANTVNIPVGFETIEAEDDMDPREKEILRVIGGLQEKLYDEVDSVTGFNYDNDEISFVVYKDGDLEEYHVPLEDLYLDIDRTEDDVDYIYQAVISDI